MRYNQKLWMEARKNRVAYPSRPAVPWLAATSEKQSADCLLSGAAAKRARQSSRVAAGSARGRLSAQRARRGEKGDRATARSV